MMNEEAVLKMLKEKHNVLIGERTTEELLFEVKRRLGDIKFSVNARSLKDGSKQTVEVSALDFL